MTTAVDPSKMQIIYPHYINSKKTRAMGRRLAASQCVPDPTYSELEEACKRLGLECIAEPERCYPRDNLFPEDRGRVRVLLKVEGVPVQEKLPNKFSLYLALAKGIQALRSERGSQKGGRNGAGAHQQPKGKGGRKNKR